MYKIMIDAGHGGVDSGARFMDIYEKDITLNVSKKLKAILEKKFKVYMTRTKDVSLGENIREDLQKRCFLANEIKADIFVSIHCNSASINSAFGFEIFCHKTSQKGNILASNIATSVLYDKKIIAKNRGIKDGNNLAVIKGTTMPAVLIELGFLSNANDRHILLNYQDDFALAIAKGIYSYFVRYEEKKDTLSSDTKNNLVSIGKFKINGNDADLRRIIIDGYNYVMLKDLAEYMKIDYDNNNKKVIINTR